MPYLPREIEADLLAWKDAPEIILLRGPRQAGKTTLFLHLAKKLGGKYLTFDDPLLRASFEEDPVAFVKRYAEPLLFLDEVQQVVNAGALLKRVFDANTGKKLFVTGSGAFDKKYGLGAYLVGRMLTFTLLPLSFREYVRWKHAELFPTLDEARRAFEAFLAARAPRFTLSFAHEFERAFRGYAQYGGYPRIVLAEEHEKERLLASLVELVLERDILFFFNVRKEFALRKTVQLLAEYSGKLLTIADLAQSIGIHRQTLEAYLSILESSLLIKLLFPFHRNRLSELRKRPKVVFTDSGFRNALLHFPPLEGFLFETLCARALQQYGELAYWRTRQGAEVDYVLLREKGPVPVECKMHGKPSRSFYSFLRTYKPCCGIILTLDARVEKGEAEGVPILTLPLWLLG